MCIFLIFNEIPMVKLTNGRVGFKISMWSEQGWLWICSTLYGRCPWLLFPSMGRECIYAHDCGVLTYPWENIQPFPFQDRSVSCKKVNWLSCDLLGDEGRRFALGFDSIQVNHFQAKYIVVATTEMLSLRGSYFIDPNKELPSYTHIYA